MGLREQALEAACPSSRPHPGGNCDKRVAAEIASDVWEPATERLVGALIAAGVSRNIAEAIRDGEVN